MTCVICNKFFNIPEESLSWYSSFCFIQGVPIRVELGPRDVKNSQFVLVRRDTGERSTLAVKDFVSKIKETIEEIHHALLSK